MRNFSSWIQEQRCFQACTKLALCSLLFDFEISDLKLLLGSVARTLALFSCASDKRLHAQTAKSPLPKEFFSSSCFRISNPHSGIRNPKSQRFSGGCVERVTPVPIPNTEVKPLGADGTARATAWESRKPPGLLTKARGRNLAGFHFGAAAVSLRTSSFISKTGIGHSGQLWIQQTSRSQRL